LDFIKRKALGSLIKFMGLRETIVIYGARQVGKTTLMKMLIDHLKADGYPEEAIFYLDLEDLELLDLCNQGVKALTNYVNARTRYKGRVFLFIDEIQYLENASSFIKLMVDNYSDRFKLIVSGSSVLDIKSKVKRSLVGRILTFEIFGLDFEEYLWFRGLTFNFDFVDDPKTWKELKAYFEEFLVYGGYPRVALISDVESKKYYLKELIQTYIKKDVRDIGKIRNIAKFNNFLRILGDQAGSLLNVDNLAKNVGLARETVYDYLMLLEGTYVLKRLSPFHRNLKSELTKMPKLYFEDSGVLNYLKHNDIIEKVTGDLLENGVFTELRKRVGLEKLWFWRTQSKQEVDFIVERKDTLVALEVKRFFSGQRLSALQYFLGKYQAVEGFVITLDKRTESKTVPSLYPWEIAGVLNA